MADRDGAGAERSAEEIRREIERTRSHMDETVEAIGDKLSPGRILDELWTRARSSEGRAAMADTVRDHPIPFALMGLGLGWLAMEQTRGRSDGVGPGTTERAEGRVGPYRGDAVNQDDPDWEHAGMATKAKARVSEAAHAVTEKISGAAGSVRDAATRIKDGTTDAAHAVADAGGSVRERVADAGHAVAGSMAHAREVVTDRVAGAAESVGGRMSGAKHAAARGARRGVEKTRDGFSQLLDQNPMALGAIAFGLGLASGISAPATAWEEERLGRVSGPLEDEAMRAVQEAAQKVKSVARDALGAARSELDRQREEVAGGDSLRQVVSQLETAAREIGRSAADAARERAESEELTAEGMKKTAERVRDRARETAD